jgi:hypothetical protein
MTAIPIIIVTDGHAIARINASDLAAWEARGWKPVSQSEPQKVELPPEKTGKRRFKTA